MTRNAHTLRRRGAWLSLGLLAAALGAPAARGKEPAAQQTVGLGAPAARAEGPADPVKALRQALQEVAMARLSPEAQRAAGERLEKLANAIFRPGDLRRALLLVEGWGPADFRQPGFQGAAELFDPVRKRLADRLERALGNTLRGGTPAAQLAALTLLADMEGEESQISSQWARQARGPHFAPRLAPAVRDLLTRAKEPDVRAAAGLTLSRISPDPEVVVPALKQLLAAGQPPGVRQVGAKALAQFLLFDYRTQTLQDSARRGQAVLPVAGQALAADGDPKVRRDCVGAIREAARLLAHDTPNLDQPREYLPLNLLPPPPGARPEQERQYRDAIGQLRKGLVPLAEALNKQTPAVIKALQDSDADVSLAAYQALEEVATARHLLKRLAVLAQLEEGKAFDGLLEKAPTAVGPLSKGLTHDNVRIRLGALYVLETLGPDAAPDAVPALARALEKKDENAFVRWGAARALAAMAPKGGEAAVGALAKGLADENKDVRYTAALALQRHGPTAKPAVKALAQAVGRKDDGRLRQLAAQALAAVGPGAKEAVPALVGALSAPEAPARAAAARALAALGGAADPKGVAALRKALQDPDAKVREAASDALLGGEPLDMEALEKQPAIKIPRPPRPRE
jgi:HEAT repeat protein